MQPSPAGSNFPTDEGAKFDREVIIDADALEPMITWGTNPGMGVPITGAVPEPSQHRRSSASAKRSRKP